VALSLFKKLFNLILIFSDFGANLGMYTLAVAAMGRHVMAVDADFKNHAFIRSANTLKGLCHEMDVFLKAYLRKRDNYTSMKLNGRT
jgi:hypothetical protein